MRCSRDASVDQMHLGTKSGTVRIYQEVLDSFVLASVAGCIKRRSQSRACDWIALRHFIDREGNSLGSSIELGFKEGPVTDRDKSASKTCVALFLHSLDWGKRGRLAVWIG